MDFDEYGYNEGHDEMMWLDEEFAPPGNYGFNNHNNRGGFRSRGPHPSQMFNKNAPIRGSRFMGPRGQSGFFWGRGYGPGGPPIQQTHDNVSFLLRCGVMHHALSGLPNVLLRLMNPESCGVCGQPFDNYDGARLHYNSKNHVKNVKKWVSQQAKVGAQRPKEIPVKARELYCELCDIHITSKSHADSHYEGRSHRAIVEGRKPPKNPFLLQKNMQIRVQKLIRRERRCLKPFEKPEPVEKPKPDKLLTPELYCEICQTTVTCTEQMTMHLNGKKHLAKEKRHIMSMMNGETSQNADAQGAAAQDAAAQGAESQEEANEPEGDTYDWGQGSGTWDDDPQ
ncbi:hypothetical protein PYW08_014033 [Mythimna loreyi]|uniref:Uncharacterized protein n=1 Tax=Mythimna loreyi TaxID=667449 RepID=A0ACC2R7K3_9NEOP|nr:hypothetical protein PYW08_014033 [Mythimna loreyi]